MKLIKKNIEKDGEGTVILQAEEIEDMWHVYNLITVGDEVRTTTIRKVVKETAAATSSSRMRLNLTIEVERVEFDPDKIALRLAGKVVKENDHVRMGAYHTLDLEINRQFHLHKLCWDAIFLERLDIATDPAKTADMAAVVCQAGLAHVCLVTSHLTLVRSRIEMSIPRKRAGNDQHGKALQRFYEAIYQAILKHVDFSQMKCVLLASPGYVKDDFFAYMNAQAIRREDRILIENRAKFILCHASSGHKHALDEVLCNPAIASKLSDAKAMQEVKALDEFFKTLENDQLRACYGYGHVQLANEHLAIDVLMVTDDLFRNSDVIARRKYVQLVEQCQQNGGRVHIFSGMHVSGEQLKQLSGIAAILRFPLPDLDFHDDPDSDDEGAVRQGNPANFDSDEGGEIIQPAHEIAAQEMGL